MHNYFRKASSKGGPDMMAHAYPADRSSFGSPALEALRVVGALSAMALFGMFFGWVAYDVGSTSNFLLSHVGLGTPPSSDLGALAHGAIFAVMTIPVGLVLCWLMGSLTDMFQSRSSIPMLLVSIGGGTASLCLVLMALAFGTPVLLAPVALYAIAGLLIKARQGH